MNFAIISITLFVLMKLIYNFFGDPSNVYWKVVFYLPLYIMIIALLRIVYFQSVRITKQFIGVVMLYFIALVLVNVVCLFKTEWYNILIINMNTFGFPAIVLLTGLAIIRIKYIKVKKP
jgi:hypothetical protein